MKLLPLFLILLTAISLSSCYQTTSDGDLRTVPVVNNPNLIPESAKADPMIQMGQ